VFDAFPTTETPNFGMLLTGVSSHAPFSVIACDLPPDKHLLDTGQFFARWRYEPVDTLDFGSDHGEMVAGYRRVDNITNFALAEFQSRYGDAITKDDVFFRLRIPARHWAVPAGEPGYRLGIPQTRARSSQTDDAGMGNPPARHAETEETPGGGLTMAISLPAVPGRGQIPLAWPGRSSIFTERAVARAPVQELRPS
jgi:hypothetical protein